MYVARLGPNCSMWDLVTQPGIKPRTPALGAWILNHWTIRKVPVVNLLIQLLIDMWAVSSFQLIQIRLL